MANDQQCSIEKLKVALNAVVAQEGTNTLIAVEEAAIPLLQWLGYMQSSLSHDVADDLLHSVQSAIIETAACLVTGLVRPALYAIRLQLESTLAWIYFNDHPVEWAHVSSSDKEFPMRGQNIKYLTTYSGRFEKRYKMLETAALRKVIEPYSLLSVHVHGTSKGASPSYHHLHDVVSGPKEVNEAIVLQDSVAEYLSDVLMAWFADRWHDLPQEIKIQLSGRLEGKELKQFCS